MTAGKRQEKAIGMGDGLWCVLPAGLVPKRHFESLRGFGGFDGWQTASFNAKKMLFWDLGAFACGVGGIPTRGLERLRWALVPLPAGVWKVLEVKTGQINHQSVCGNRFYVKDSIRCHAHTCPVCATVVWSPHSSGRIACKHDTPLGQRCRTITSGTFPTRMPRDIRNGNKSGYKRKLAQGCWSMPQCQQRALVAFACKIDVAWVVCLRN